MTMLKNLKNLGALLVVWLLGTGLAFAQVNSIEAFDVAQQGGNIVVRITTKEPVSAVPPSFTVANPARITLQTDLIPCANGVRLDADGPCAGTT